MNGFERAIALHFREHNYTKLAHICAETSVTDGIAYHKVVKFEACRGFVKKCVHNVVSAADLLTVIVAVYLSTTLKCQFYDEL